MTRKVFVLFEDTKKDVSDAGRFGEITYVYPTNEPHPKVWTNSFVQDMLKRLSDLQFNPEVDYVVVSGTVVPLVLLLTRLARDYQTLNMLLYDSSVDEYIHKAVL